MVNRYEPRWKVWVALSGVYEEKLHPYIQLKDMPWTTAHSWTELVSLALHGLHAHFKHLHHILHRITRKQYDRAMATASAYIYMKYCKTACFLHIGYSMTSTGVIRLKFPPHTLYTHPQFKQHGMEMIGMCLCCVLQRNVPVQECQCSCQYNIMKLFKSQACANNNCITHTSNKNNQFSNDWKQFTQLLQSWN